MERRSFVKFLASIPLIGYGLAGGQSESVEPEAKKFDFSDLYISPEAYAVVNRDGRYIDYADDAQELYEQSMAAPTKDLNENGQYDPRWNVSGSWNKAESRTSLISHLSGSNHGHKRSYLETLSTDELQKLHDTDHNSRTPTRRRRWFR